MKEQHLSDEAVAAFADGVLTGHARERARRHTAACAECAQAVTAQREAVFLLRRAPAPSLPIGLFDRLVQVPANTPIRSVPSAMSDDGNALFASFGTMAAFVPPAGKSKTRKDEKDDESAEEHDGKAERVITRHMRPLFVTTAAVAAAGVLTVASASSASGSRVTPQQARPASSVNSTVEDAAYLPLPQPAGTR